MHKILPCLIRSLFFSGFSFPHRTGNTPSMMLFIAVWAFGCSPLPSLVLFYALCCVVCLAAHPTLEGICALGLDVPKSVAPVAPSGLWGVGSGPVYPPVPKVQLFHCWPYQGYQNLAGLSLGPGAGASHCCFHLGVGQQWVQGEVYWVLLQYHLHPLLCWI